MFSIEALNGGYTTWLQELGEERVEASASRLGWLDQAGGDGDALAPAAA